jgi:transcriptional regulator with XRE-family HTH domain
MKFGQSVKRIRESIGMTQEQFELISGFRTGNISRYETGKPGFTNPRLSTIRNIAGALDVSMSELLQGVD